MKIAPMDIRVQPGDEPVRVKLLRYAKPQADFFQRNVAELETLRLILRNPEKAWSCSPQIVLKDRHGQYQLTHFYVLWTKSPFLM